MQNSRTKRVLVAAGLVVVAAACSYVAAGMFRKPSPQPFVAADSSPLDIAKSGDHWYWIERPDKAKAHLVRASRSGKEILAGADDIAGYSVQGDSVVWSARNGDEWSVARRRGDRTGVVWTGKEVAGRPALAGDLTAWAIVRRGRQGESMTLPSLGPTVEIRVTNGDGKIRSVGRLIETQCDVIGIRGEMAYVVCQRKQGTAQTVIYAVSMKDGSARRVMGEEGDSQVVLLNNGVLVWTAYSRDSSSPANIQSIRSLSPGQPAVTRADWLPPVGLLFSTGDSAVFVSRFGTSDLWRIGRSNDLIAPLQAPAGFAIMAAGDREILLQGIHIAGKKISLFTTPRL